MVGVFPPPVHGMAMVNAAMYEQLCSRGASPLVLNLAPATLQRSWLNRLGRIRRVVACYVSFLGQLRHAGAQTLYVGLSGGWGQLYEALFALTARVTNRHIFLHHHSFAYLDHATLFTRLLVWCSGPSATHVVICELQASRLKQHYPGVARTMVISNAAITNLVTLPARTRTTVARIGFLGNISFAKGISEVIAVAERLLTSSVDFEVYIAGPFEDPAAETSVTDASQRLGNIKYIGSKYGSEKDAFWELIDVLLFPSKYVNETAPLVVYEAMARGIPVIAWSRGCLGEMMPPNAGVLVPQGQDYVTVAVEHLLEWKDQPERIVALSEGSERAFSEQKRKSIGQLSTFIDELLRSSLSPGQELQTC